MLVDPFCSSPAPKTGGLPSAKVKFNGFGKDPQTERTSSAFPGLEDSTLSVWVLEETRRRLGFEITWAKDSSSCARLFFPFNWTSCSVLCVLNNVPGPRPGSLSAGHVALRRAPL